MKQLIWYRNGYYTLYSDGKIRKPDGYKSDGKTWEWLGLHKILPFGNISPLIPRNICVDIKDLKYKNGKYKYIVADRDHGTYRTWG